MIGLVEIMAPDFDLELTMESGQLFHWQKAGAGFVGLIGSVPVYIEQRDESLRVPKGREALVSRYFALDHPMAEIYETFPKDPAMAEALKYCWGIRIVRQPVWECVATFITSAMKQVPHIRQMSAAIRSRYGRRIAYAGHALYSYPAPKELAALNENALRECALGYRAKNLLGTAKMIASGEVDLKRIGCLDDDAALRELCRLPGVGEKVANCILLFAYERMRAFPIDVWIDRVLRGTYLKGKRKVTPSKMKQFASDYFGEYGGYAQQYLFHHARQRSR